MQEDFRSNQTYEGNSPAAVTSFAAVGAAEGEEIQVNELVAWHDDVGGATLNWYLDIGGVGMMIPIGATAAGVKVRLGAYYGSMPLIIPYDGYLAIEASAPLSAVGSFYVQYHARKLRGVPSGMWT
jgi:hypothetical protein